MKTNRILQYLAMATCAVMFAFVTGCEGPQGPAGLDGTDGVDGVDGADGADANETCKLCHNPESVDLITTQFQLSKHEYGGAAFEEAGNTTCSPCHTQEAFKDMVARNVPATFTIKPPATRYTLDYVTLPSTAYGEIGCSTCHSSIHNSYDASDLPSLTTVAPVDMVMWGAAKTIDLPADGGTSNLCVKCHQPRPLTRSSDGNVLDYAALVSNPTATFNQLTPAYRSHVHYGSVGAIMAGKGGIEFNGSVAYGNSPHTANASCQDCHMGEVNGRAGGHTFSAIGNYNGCNTTGCHTDLSSSSAIVTNSKAAIKAKLDALAAKIQVGGVEILNRNPDSEHNLWYNATTNHYDGYLNVYDPNSNPDGPANNPTGQFKNTGNTSNWTQAQKDYNNTLPVLSMTNAHMGSIINFQMCLREFSMGMHNYKYSAALLDNSIERLP
jgi:hypothetical protein